MIKVTQKMREALKRKLQPTPFEPTMDDALEAVLKLIDPVPNEVRELETLDNEEMRRVMAGPKEAPIGTDVWRHECGCCFSTYAELVADGAIERWQA
jgi:hypothetical protein